MPTLSQALRGAVTNPGSRCSALLSALVVGAGAALGSAVLAEALVAGRFQQVAAVGHGALWLRRCVDLQP